MYVYYATRMSIIFNTFSKKMSHEINRASRLLYKVTFCNTKLPEVEVVLGLFLPKHCTITPERATLNLAGI